MSGCPPEKHVCAAALYLRPSADACRPPHRPEKRDEIRSCFNSRLHHETGDNFSAGELTIPQEEELTRHSRGQEDFNDCACSRSRQMMKRPEATMMKMPIHL